ncbi:roundabout homolog 1-like [Physella acuta]|uniref:roundabout homolog 1-like n=1 Tax=Physella acuta TaxID=109671 RepID=UPI0027DB95C3|nr:roundabout homolog 1-like [Physella acuta]XP_059171660.1 roundabout homolog 1-like [Physella acuta]
MRLTCVQHCLLLALMTSVTFAKKPNKSKKQDSKKVPLTWKEDSTPGSKKTQITVAEEKPFTLDCRTSGHPKPKITWFRNNLELKSSDIEVKNSILTVKAMTVDLGGNYTCKAVNKHGDISWTVKVDVQARKWPLIIDSPQNVTAFNGSTASFSCSALNDPDATIKWSRRKEKLGDDASDKQWETLNVQGDPRLLTLTNVSKAHEGEYQCTAGNVWGIRHNFAWLTVIEPIISYVEPEPGNRGNHGDTFPYETTKHPMESEDSNDIVEGFNYEDLDVTTRKSRNRNQDRNKNKNKNKNKDKKDKTKKPTPVDRNLYPTTYMPPREPELDRTTGVTIWNYGTTYGGGASDARYPGLETTSEPVTARSGHGSDTHKGGISAWTIYTVVGAVGGVILLIGLIAITLTLCCKKEDDGAYKSTSV